MCECPQFRGRKTNLLLPSIQELLEFGNMTPRALNTLSPHVIMPRQHQQSHVLEPYKHDARDDLALLSLKDQKNRERFVSL